jgi:hypothetical protein
MRRLILTFLVVIAVGGATGASAAHPRYGTAYIHPPSLSSDVTCSAQANGTKTCFYPAQSRYFFPTPAR